MRKRLSVAVAAMILACAISPAAVWAEKSPTTDTTVTNEESAENDIETPDSDEQREQDVQGEQGEQDVQDVQGDQDVQDEQDLLDAPPVYAAPPTSTTTVATINGQSYDSLQDAIDHAEDGQEIVLQSNVELTTGLTFSGTQDASIDAWKNFIINADGHKIIMEGKGIEATFCNVVIQNCPELTIHASVTPGVLDSSHLAACFFGHATLTLDNCPKVTITNDQEEGNGGSGICVYNEGSLYFKNGTNVAISGYLAGTDTEHGVSGIYMDKDPGNNDIMGEIVISDNSTLTISNCHHNGITANPANITVTGNSTLDVNNNNNNGVGKGGIGCYFGKLTVTDNSHVIASKNTGRDYAIFVNDLYVDKSSDVSAIDNGDLFGGCYGITIGGHGVVEGKLTASGNWGPGVSAYYDDEDCSLTVKSGGQITSCDNYNYGIANASTFTVKSGATVTLQRNLAGGLDNYPAATTTVEEKANFIATNNYGVGINNGNNTTDAYGNPFTASAANVATLILKSGLIRENHNVGLMPCPPYQFRASVDYGAGICNRYGNVDISIDTKIYNNHADKAGDDLYNYPLDATAAAKNTISLTIPGAVWEKLDKRDGGGIIDNWYDDSENNRWNAATHAVICEDSKSSYRFTLPDGQPAWKAAHGAVAPTPSPSPTPDPTATPVPTNEPSAVPTTAPVAPVTRVDATATPAPTDAPTQQPTTAPTATAQPTATIPQTGDAAPLALFGGLTISSAAAFYFLRKRRKSE